MKNRKRENKRGGGVGETASSVRTEVDACRTGVGVTSVGVPVEQKEREKRDGVLLFPPRDGVKLWKNFFFFLCFYFERVRDQKKQAQSVVSGLKDKRLKNYCKIDALLHLLLYHLSVCSFLFYFDGAGGGCWKKNVREIEKNVHLKTASIAPPLVACHLSRERRKKK